MENETQSKATTGWKTVEKRQTPCLCNAKADKENVLEATERQMQV